MRYLETYMKKEKKNDVWLEWKTPFRDNIRLLKYEGKWKLNAINIAKLCEVKLNTLSY